MCRTLSIPGISVVPDPHGSCVHLRAPGTRLFRQTLVWLQRPGRARRSRRWSRLVSAAAIVTLPFVASGQERDRWSDPTAPTHVEQSGQFVFTRIRYGGYRSTWNHDYPRADRHLPQILDDITMIDVHLGDSNVFRLDNPELFTHPIAYISEPGFWSMSEPEVQGLRDYWLKGGFVIFDDFEAEQWDNFAQQVHRALPDHQLIEIDVTHPIFQVFRGGPPQLDS